MFWKLFWWVDLDLRHDQDDVCEPTNWLQVDSWLSDESFFLFSVSCPEVDCDLRSAILLLSETRLHHHPCGVLITNCEAGGWVHLTAASTIYLMEATKWIWKYEPWLRSEEDCGEWTQGWHRRSRWILRDRYHQEPSGTCGRAYDLLGLVEKYLLVSHWNFSS